jgi:hypothetical protein
VRGRATGAGAYAIPWAAPLRRRRTVSSTPHPFLGGAPVAAGAPTTNWCGADQLVRERVIGAGAYALGVPHRFVGVAPFPRRRTVSSASHPLHLVRRRPAGARTSNWCGSVRPPWGCRTASSRPFLDAAPFPRPRTLSSAAHPLQRVRGRPTRARTPNWCADDQLVRERPTGEGTVRDPLRAHRLGRTRTSGPGSAGAGGSGCGSPSRW